MNRKSTLFYAIIAVILLITINGSFAQEIGEDLFKELKYRHIGPVGNRVIAVVGIPEDPNTYFIGAASGGIFKTTDGGTTWEPIFDKQDVSSVGSLAIAPSDHNVIWAGTGETFIRSNISVGNGIYKSVDGGRTWKNMGLELTGRIGRIVIDPRNSDVVFAAALGHCYGPQQER
ncbi:MAG: sialidase, partial [Planctomycetes bacterium]|nr:sialidase [Planctomycetota bacterium]